MKVKDLIEKLSEYPEDMDVIIFDKEENECPIQGTYFENWVESPTVYVRTIYKNKLGVFNDKEVHGSEPVKVVLLDY